MEFAIIIQARTGSKRFPQKVLKNINEDTNVLDFLIKRILKKFNKKNLIIATTRLKEDLGICSIAKKNKIKYFTGSKNDLMKRYIDCAKFYRVKNVIRITSDCPLIDPKLIKKMYKIYKREEFDYFSNTLPLKLSTYPDGSDIEIFRLSSLIISSKMPCSKSDREHVTNNFWKKKNSFKIGILESAKNFSKFRYCIDYEDDLIVLRKIVEVLKKKKIEGSTNQIVKVLKDNSKLFKISKKNRDKYLKNRKDLN